MAQHRHKRVANARTMPRSAQIAAPIAVVATLSAVTMGVLSATPSLTADQDLLASSASTSVTSSALASRRAATTTVSRSKLRTAARAEARARSDIAADKAARRADKVAHRATLRAVKTADTRLWTAEALNLWTAPGEAASKVGVLDAIEKVLVTGRREGGRAEVVINGRSRWVSAEYLAEKKPETGPALGGTCSNGSSIDAGRASLYKIHDVVCSNWPEVGSYGTWRGDGDHGQGRAVDIMVSGATGWAIANFLRANYATFDIEYIIFSQNIWSVERSGEGWRGMSDRGSTTANHYDHVHVTVY